MSKSKNDRFMSAFLQQFPNFKQTDDNHAIEFTDQGSKFRIYAPYGKYHSDGSAELTLKMDHIVGGAPDDHAEINVKWDSEGRYKESPFITYNMSGGIEIPTWAMYSTEMVLIGTNVTVGVITGVIQPPINQTKF